jgi:DNA-binding transcriptional LysR family regulator
MKIDLRHLRQFLAVAEEGSFSRAAARLGMAQPPLSQAIARLEGRLGTRLFVRTSQAVTLTEAGRVLMDEARPLLAQHAAMTRRVADAVAGATGHLAVAFVMSAGSSLLPSVLRRFCVQCPGVTLSLQELTTSQQVEALIEGRCDIGLLRPPLFGAEELEVETVRREAMLVALPSDHSLAARTEIVLADLAEESFIAPPAMLGPGMHSRMMDACQGAGFVPRIAQEATQMQTIVALVAGGLGVALVPECVTALGLHGVVYRPILAETGVPPLELAWATRRLARQRKPVIRDFIATMVSPGEDPAPARQRVAG